MFVVAVKDILPVIAPSDQMIQTALLFYPRSACHNGEKYIILNRRPAPPFVVFDYEPNPAFKPQTRNEKLFTLCSVAVWVDAEKKQVVRLDAQLTKSAGNFLAKAKRGASFLLENELVNNEIWLPARADVDLSIKILFAGVNINVLILSNDYRRFTTDVKEVTVGDEKKP